MALRELPVLLKKITTRQLTLVVQGQMPLPYDVVDHLPFLTSEQTRTYLQAEINRRHKHQESFGFLQKTKIIVFFFAQAADQLSYQLYDWIVSLGTEILY